MTTELLTDPKHTRGDLRQIESAIRKGWQIPDQLFEKAGLVIGQILSKGSNREKVALSRCILSRAYFASILPPLVAMRALKISPRSFWRGWGSFCSSFAILWRS